jgi:hypothetical protein
MASGTLSINVSSKKIASSSCKVFSTASLVSPPSAW